jgi:hypothetical protein
MTNFVIVAFSLTSTLRKVYSCPMNAEIHIIQMGKWYKKNITP